MGGPFVFQFAPCCIFRRQPEPQSGRDSLEPRGVGIIDLPLPWEPESGDSGPLSIHLYLFQAKSEGGQGACRWSMIYCHSGYPWWCSIHHVLLLLVLWSCMHVGQLVRRRLRNARIALSWEPTWRALLNIFQMRLFTSPLRANRRE